MPGNFPGTVPSLRVATVARMPVVLTLSNGVLLYEGPQRPALQRAVGRPGRPERQFALGAVFHLRLSNRFDPLIISFLSNRPFGILSYAPVFEGFAGAAPPQRTGSAPPQQPRRAARN